MYEGKQPPTRTLAQYIEAMTSGKATGSGSGLASKYARRGAREDTKSPAYIFSDPLRVDNKYNGPGAVPLLCFLLSSCF